MKIKHKINTQKNIYHNAGSWSVNDSPKMILVILYLNYLTNYFPSNLPVMCHLGHVHTPAEYSSWFTPTMITIKITITITVLASTPTDNNILFFIRLCMSPAAINAQALYSRVDSDWSVLVN